MMMDSAERDERVMGLVAETLQRPLRDRDSFLQSRCHSDPDLYREVSEIVSWEERMGDFLRRPLIEFIDLEALEQIFEPGQVVAGRFEILRRVGDGGMGVVYEAYDNKRKQRIAIKCAKPGFDRLLSPELERAREVRHQNICLVNEIHTTNTELGELDFLTMEFLDGETLAHRLESGKFEEADALSVARQLCSGVAEAHRSQVMHRDLKPGNIILCRKKDGSTRAVITDFGLATQAGTADELEGGTPNYMAPELWRGGKASQASDIFSLGVILYEMVTGCKPFPALTKDNVAFPQPVAPSKLIRNLPRRWDAAILPCLKEKPDQRDTAESVLAALERKSLYRRPVALAVLAACLALIAVATSVIINLHLFTPAPYSLVILPPEASGDLAQQSQSILAETARRIRQIQPGRATVSVIPPEKASARGVATPEQAAKTFGATYALQVKLQPDADGVSVEGAIIDLHNMAHLPHGDYSGHFAANDLPDLSTGLTGTAAWGLDIPRTTEPETVNSAATPAYKRGREFLEREPHDYASSIPAFQEAARLDPHSPLPLAGLAEAHVREFQTTGNQNALEEALAWLAKAEALNADATRVRLTSGLMHQIQGNYGKAVADYQRAESTSPRNVDAWLGLGFALESQGMLNEAIADYKRGIDAEPANYKPYEYLGGLYYYHGRYSEAEGPFLKDITLAPDRIDAYGSLGAVYTAEFKYADAEKIYRDALQRSESAMALNNLGAMLAFQGQDYQAIGYYRRAVTLASDRYLYWQNLGDSQRRTHDLAGARNSYQRGLAQAMSHVVNNTASASARSFVAYFQARLGSKDQARQQIAAALNSPARDDQVVVCAVETYEALGDRKNALAAAKMATSQTLNQISHRPDLVDLSRDPEFAQILLQKRAQ